MGELGLAVAQGREGLRELLAIARDETDHRLPNDARASLSVLAAQLMACTAQIAHLEKRIHAQHRANEVSRRLEAIPGIGVVGATAITATLSDPTAFRTGRDFAAWVGLVPREDSTGLQPVLHLAAPAIHVRVRGRIGDDEAWIGLAIGPLSHADHPALAVQLLRVP
jgi:transposase